jgi:hypothetical protein
MWSKASLFLVAVVLTPHLGARVNASDSSVKVKVEVEVCGTLSFTDKEAILLVKEPVTHIGILAKATRERKWVLDLGTAEALRKKAKGLHGKVVVVKGKAVLLGVKSETFKYKGAVPAVYTNPPLKAPDLIGTRTTLELEHKVEVTSLTAAPGK